MRGGHCAGEKVKVKKQFSFLPPLVWCGLLDAIDFVSVPISTILIALVGTAPLGIAIEKVIDAIQVLLGLMVFEGNVALLASSEFVLPGPFNIFPSYIAIWVYENVLNQKPLIK